MNRRLGIAVTLAVLSLAGLWYVSRDRTDRGPQATAPTPAASTGGTTPGNATGTPAPAQSTPGVAGPAPTAAASGSLPPVDIEEGRIRGGDPSGRVQWELRADSLQVDADRQEVRLTGVEGTFLERGHPAVAFAAPRAVYDMGTRDIVMSGGVRARAGEHRSVQAAEVRYLASRRLLVATGGVRLTQERMVVLADRLESDVALRRTRLSGRITVTIRE